MKSLAVMALVWAMLQHAGCGVAAIKAQNRAVDQQNRQVYETYRLYLQSLNQQRESAGLSPLPVKSYEAWQQSPGTN